jgi:hypothetical protein
MMETRPAAKAVETATNGGDTRNMMKHEGHDLLGGGTGRPHYQTEGAYGPTFWGRMYGLYMAIDETLKVSGEEIWKDIKSDPIGAICFICSGGNQSNDSDKVGAGSPTGGAKTEQISRDQACGVSCGARTQQEQRERNQKGLGQGPIMFFKLKKKYRVAIEGQNLLMDVNGIRRFGYFTTRYVRKNDRDDASAFALALVLNELNSTGALLNDVTDPPVATVSEITQVDSFSGLDTPGRGFTFFPEE